MDRDNRWERIQRSYKVIAESDASEQAPSALAALQSAYDRGEDDEFVPPTCIGEPVAMTNGDALLFMNFRADRARQLSQALIDPAFTAFARVNVTRLRFVATTEYASSLACPCLLYTSPSPRDATLSRMPSSA